LADKARSLYKTAGETAVAPLIFEAMLLGAAANIHLDKSDLLNEATKLFEVDVKALRANVERAGQKRTEKNTKAE
jgi:hypothetical protein